MDCKGSEFHELSECQLCRITGFSDYKRWVIGYYLFALLRFLSIADSKVFCVVFVYFGSHSSLGDFHFYHVKIMVWSKLISSRMNSVQIR